MLIDDTDDLIEVLLTFRRAEPGLTRWYDVYDRLVRELTRRGIDVGSL